MAMLDRTDFRDDVAPQPGHYRVRLARGGPWVPVRVYYEGEHDDDGELVEDETLYCELGESLIDGPALWATLKHATCVKIDEAEWKFMIEIME